MTETREGILPPDVITMKAIESAAGGSGAAPPPVEVVMALAGPV